MCIAHVPEHKGIKTNPLHFLPSILSLFIILLKPFSLLRSRSNQLHPFPKSLSSSGLHGWWPQARSHFLSISFSLLKLSLSLWHRDPWESPWLELRSSSELLTTYMTEPPWLAPTLSLSSLISNSGPRSGSVLHGSSICEVTTMGLTDILWSLVLR